MKKILISGCLYGDVVRYDGNKVDWAPPLFRKWKEEGRLVPVCPEVFGGLPVPRSDCQRVGELVKTRLGEDVTEAFRRGAEEAVRLAKEYEVAFAIMKERSPSCGSSIVYDGSFSGNKIPGEGLAVQHLREAGFSVYNEDQLEQAIQENALV
jgi:uncharacterized protein YbbK (DUF523 family)